MARPTFDDAVYALQQSPSPDAQVAALKHLKNALIGQAGNKRDFVRQGILDVLAHVLQAAAKARGKRREQSSNGELHSTAKHSVAIEEDEVQLQALLVLSSITQGGPEYVTPVLASSILFLVLDALSPSHNHAKAVAAALRIFLNLADVARYAGPKTETLQVSSAMDALYSDATLRTFGEILMQKSHTSIVQTQLSYVCQIFTVTCRTEYHCVDLGRRGILDLLGARLAAYHAHQRFFSVRLHPSIVAALPPPPTHQNLPHVLSAVTTIIGHSKYRVARLLRSPQVMSVFPFHKPDAANDSSTSSVSQPGIVVNPIEFRLPQLQIRSENGFARAFPSLGSAHASNQQATFPELPDTASSVLDSVSQHGAFESSIVSWLLVTFREERGLHRLQAANLLATINLAGFVNNKSRDRTLALLVIPPLLEMLDQKSLGSSHAAAPNTQMDSLIILEKAPVILGTIIEKNPKLQSAAVDGGVLKKVGQLLKQSLEPFEPRPPVWSPTEFDPHLDDVPPSRRLGAPGLRPELVHLLKCRSGALSLVAAIADKDDKYRKQLTENGIVAHIIDSMAPFKEDALLEIERHAYSANKQNIQPALMGNSVEVILAACGAARALSRSVALLRTSLIDAGLAKPVIALLKHPNVMVVKAATDVVCNIITDFSPMREDFVAAGAVKTLCDHAHSADSTIRLVSLWALKHLMLKSPNDVKLACFEELGTGWLVQIINGGPSAGKQSKASSQPAMGAANAAGERIDILNAVDEPMDTAEDVPEEDMAAHSIPSQDVTLIDDSILKFLISSTNTDADFANLAAQYRSRLKIIRDAEDRFTASQAYADEIKIQCQGLGILRNMVLPPRAGDMIEELLRSLGSNTIFDIIISKFKAAFASIPPRNTATLAGLNNTDTTASNSPATDQDEQNATRDMLDSAVNILVHICAGEAKHRHLIISQPNLLRSLLPLLSHPDPGIRASTVWVPINLTWWDNDRDRVPARQRALELRKLGFEEKLKEMWNDEAIDVKQRVATAREQISELLDDGGHRSSDTGGAPGRGVSSRVPVEDPMGRSRDYTR